MTAYHHSKVDRASLRRYRLDVLHGQRETEGSIGCCFGKDEASHLSLRREQRPARVARLDVARQLIDQLR